MTPTQMLALLQLLADLRTQVGELLVENQTLRAQVEASQDEAAAATP